MTDKGELVVVGACIDCLGSIYPGHTQMEFAMQPLFLRTLMPTGAGKKAHERRALWKLWNCCCVVP